MRCDPNCPNIGPGCPDSPSAYTAYTEVGRSHPESVRRGNDPMREVQVRPVVLDIFIPHTEDGAGILLFS